MLPKVPVSPISDDEERAQVLGLTHRSPLTSPEAQKEPEDCVRKTVEVVAETSVDESGRERLKRHRREIAGMVWIPEKWGQEKLLTEWADCTAFDRSLFPTGLLPAREALVDECRRAGAGLVRIANSC